MLEEVRKLPLRAETHRLASTEVAYLKVGRRDPRDDSIPEEGPVTIALCVLEDVSIGDEHVEEQAHHGGLGSSNCFDLFDIVSIDHDPTRPLLVSGKLHLTKIAWTLQDITSRAFLSESLHRLFRRGRENTQVEGTLQHRVNRGKLSPRALTQAHRRRAGADTAPQSAWANA